MGHWGRSSTCGSSVASSFWGQSQSSSSADIGQWRHQLSRFHYKEWGGAPWTDKKVYKALNISIMMYSEVAFLLLNWTWKGYKWPICSAFEDEQEDKRRWQGWSAVILPDPILSHPSLESTRKDEHTNGGRGVHRSAKKTVGKDDKGDSKGSGRHLFYLALSPPPEYWDWLEAFVLWIPWSNAGQFLSMAPLCWNSIAWLLHWKMKPDCCKKGGCWMLCLEENDSGPTCLRGNPKAPATTTIRRRVLYQYNKWVEIRLT